MRRGMIGLFLLTLFLGIFGCSSSAYGQEAGSGAAVYYAQAAGGSQEAGSVQTAASAQADGVSREPVDQDVQSAMDNTADQIGLGEDMDQIQDFLDRQLNAGGSSFFSFTSLMKSLLTGDLKGVLGQAGQGLESSLVGEVGSGSRLLAQVVAIGIIGAGFFNFSSVFKGGSIADTGFFVT